MAPVFSRAAWRCVWYMIQVCHFHQIIRVMLSLDAHRESLYYAKRKVFNYSQLSQIDDLSFLFVMSQIVCRISLLKHNQRTESHSKK